MDGPHLLLRIGFASSAIIHLACLLELPGELSKWLKDDHEPDKVTQNIWESGGPSLHLSPRYWTVQHVTPHREPLSSICASTPHPMLWPMLQLSALTRRWERGRADEQWRHWSLQLRGAGGARVERETETGCPFADEGNLTDDALLDYLRQQLESVLQI